MYNAEKTNNDLLLLSPFFRHRVEVALREVHDAGYDMFIFEGFRSPARQELLYAKGRTTEGKKVTNARAWQSWHQFGLAVDLVYKINNRWTWEGDFDKPSEIMQRHGFEWLGAIGDKPHYQMTAGFTTKEAKKLVDKESLQILWTTVEEAQYPKHVR